MEITIPDLMDIVRNSKNGIGSFKGHYFDLTRLSLYTKTNQKISYSLEELTMFTGCEKPQDEVIAPNKEDDIFNEIPKVDKTHEIKEVNEPIKRDLGILSDSKNPESPEINNDIEKSSWDNIPTFENKMKTDIQDLSYESNINLDLPFYKAMNGKITFKEAYNLLPGFAKENRMRMLVNAYIFNKPVYQFGRVHRTNPNEMCRNKIVVNMLEACNYTGDDKDLISLYKRANKFAGEITGNSDVSFVENMYTILEDYIDKFRSNIDERNASLFTELPKNSIFSIALSKFKDNKNKVIQPKSLNEFFKQISNKNNVLIQNIPVIDDAFVVNTSLLNRSVRYYEINIERLNYKFTSNHFESLDEYNVREYYNYSECKMKKAELIFDENKKCTNAHTFREEFENLRKEMVSIIHTMTMFGIGESKFMSNINRLIRELDDFMLSK